MNSISPNLNLMIKSWEKVSKVLIRDFGEVEKLQVSIKGPKNFVTNSDRKVEDKLVNELSKSKKKIYTSISFIDIAGLVKGASKGEGLGNKFLSHIREVDAIIHMIRCFESDDIQNVNKNVDPIRDLEIIETEMKLADIESIEKRLEKRSKNKNSWY